MIRVADPHQLYRRIICSYLRSAKGVQNEPFRSFAIRAYNVPTDIFGSERGVIHSFGRIREFSSVAPVLSAIKNSNFFIGRKFPNCKCNSFHTHPILFRNGGFNQNGERRDARIVMVLSVLIAIAILYMMLSAKDTYDDPTPAPNRS